MKFTNKLKLFNNIEQIKERIQTTNLSKHLFYIGYFLIVLSSIYDNIIEIQRLMFFTDIISILLFILSISCSLLTSKNISKKTILKMSIFVIAIFISSILSNNRALIKMPFAILAFIGISTSFHKLAQHDLVIRSGLLIILVFLTMSGINHNTFTEYRNGIMRSSFGMSHPNALGFELAIICADLFYLTTYKNTIKSKAQFLLPLIISAAAFLFVYRFVDSRTSMLLIFLLSIAYILRNKINYSYRIISLLAKNTFLIFFIISFIGVIFFQNGFPIAQKLDTALSYRLHIGASFLERYGLSPFGQPIENTQVLATEQPYPLDNAYLNLLIQFGLFLTLCFIILYYKSIKTLIIDNQTMLISIMIILAFYGLSETSFFIISKNPFLFLLAYGFAMESQIKNPLIYYRRKILERKNPIK